MDMGYPMGPLMECPMGGWIPLNLPWKCPMTHAMWQAMACTVVWPWNIIQGVYRGPPMGNTVKRAMC